MKDIVGYEGRYKVNRHGKVMSYLHKIPMQLKHLDGTGGYKFIGLSNKDHVVKVARVHRIIAQAFIPNPENKPLINHKNGIKSDNRIKNLEWCTASENVQHSYDTGLKTSEYMRGEKHHSSKLNKKQVLKIRLLSKKGMIISEIAAKFKVTPQAIRQIVKRIKWIHV